MTAELIAAYSQEEGELAKILVDNGYKVDEKVKEAIDAVKKSCSGNGCSHGQEQISQT